MTEMKDLVSVVIPAYNVSEYIGECLDSILSQTYPNIEIIVVDDGSKDQTGAICDRYAQNASNIRVIHQANGGANNARMTGVMAAAGKWITLVDGDDTLGCNAIQTMLEHATDDCAIVLSGYSEEHTFSSAEYGEKLLTWSIHALFGKLYRRDVIAHEDIFATPRWLVVGEDFLSNIKAVKYIGDDIVSGIPQQVYNYRQRSGSLMHSFKNDGEYDYRLLKLVKEEIESASLNIRNLANYEIGVLSHLIMSRSSIDTGWLESLKKRCTGMPLSKREQFILSSTDSLWKREALIAEKKLRKIARQILVLLHLR